MHRERRTTGRASADAFRHIRPKRTLRHAIAIAGWALAVLCLMATDALAQPVPPSCPAQLGSSTIVRHDMSVSFCELCTTGQARIIVENDLTTFPGDVDYSQIVVTENLRNSGLTYAGNTSFSFNNAIPTAVVPPAVSGTNNEILTWTLAPGFTLPEVGGFGNSSSLTITFDVARDPSFTEEGLVSADRDIQASVVLEPSCAPGDTYGQITGLNELPLREPDPDLAIDGRNLDAGQGGWSDPVYGHEGDDVIWRLRVRNDGQAPLQDFIFDMGMLPGDFTMTHVCTTNAAAVSASNGGSPAQCRSLGGVSDAPNLDIAALFGGGANPYIVLGPNGAQRFFYFVGVANTSCNTVDALADDAQWGCQSEPPPGGISQTSDGSSDVGTGELRTLSNENNLDFQIDFQGVNDPTQPLGARGNVVVTIRNVSGGTIYGDTDGIELEVDLPTQYVVDPSLAPAFAMTPAYGPYAGMVDTMTWDNPDPGTDPNPATGNPADQLANDFLQFTLTSSGANAEFPNQQHMIRHGDVVTITIRVVQIDDTYYDLTGNLDVRLEDPASSPANTDPTQAFAVSGQAEITYEEFCTGGTHVVTDVENDTANPEDLDVDLVGTELVFILTATGDPLPLAVELTNNGGHDAEDYQAYVTFGEAMQVSTADPDCSVTSNPPPLPEWQLPDPLPATGTIYVCDRGTIGPGVTERFDFEVVKNPSPPFDDDLTFRADVIGESHLANGTPLWFPVPQPRGDGITDRGNNYSIDGIRARVVGYNLLKTQFGDCNEDNPPPGSPDDLVQIGEECSFRVESGGWFGFQTPGFTYIAVQNIQVVDDTPDGQTYISHVDPLVESTSAIAGVTFTPPAVPLSDDDFDWRFNTNPATERITELDHWFRTNFTTRIMNDPIDTVATPPNQHAATTSNVLTSTFEAVFFNPNIPGEEIFTLGPNTLGFPREVFRRVDLTVTEPQLTVVKEVCNETLNGVGPACGVWNTIVTDGDAFDEYVYRIRITNAPSGSGVVRAPAYDVTVTSVTDASDQLEVIALTGDGLDNDGDAPLIDAGDVAGEGTITDTVTENGVPAQVIASYTHSDALLRIDPGQTVELYYRVDPDDDVAPLQALTSTVTATYDSLEGDFGSQSAPQRPNGDEAGARRYTSNQAQATIQIIPVEVSPKEVVQTSHTPVAGLGVDQPAVIGEELEFQLEALIPVSQLRAFTIRDTLPAGLTCAEAPDVDLDAAPYDAAGFVPGGTFSPTCTADEVVWSFGDQTVTTTDRVDRRFEFAVRFVGRIENVDANRDGTTIVNGGGGGSDATVEYVNESGGGVVLPIGSATIVVTEPQVDLTKVFSVAQVDAGDLPRVTVTATNNGTSVAHNLRVLEDLTHPELAFAGDVQGASPPNVDTVTFGADRPLFSWSPGLSLAPGASVSFSFAVQVGATPAPHEVLDNTIQADWTSLPGSTTALNSSGTIGVDGAADGMRIGALPNAGDTLNDYESEASASVDVPPLAFVKTDLDPALAPEIGAHKLYELAVVLPEGETQNVVVDDALDAGDVSWVLAHDATRDITYQFDGIAQINGLPPGEAALLAFPADGATGTITWNVGTVTTLSEDDLATSAVTPTIRIRYYARINNDLVTDAGDALQNVATADYTNGQTAATESLVSPAAPIVATESALTAAKVLANVTVGKAPGDPPAFDDILEYTVTILNGDIATAYDVNIVDTLPPELELDTSFTPTATLGGVPIAGFVATPAGSPDGPLVWGRGNGDDSIDIPSGGVVDLTYRIHVRTPLPDPSVLANRVWVDWTSLDGASSHERTGAGCPTTTPPDDYCFGPAVASDTSVPVPPPAAAAKDITQPTASVGESFRYTITVPSTPYAFPIYDVRILDDLASSAADLRYVQVDKVSTWGAWTPTNAGTDTDLILTDGGAGFDIPAGEQVEIDVTVVVEDTATNVTGRVFTNAASYTYLFNAGDPGPPRVGAVGVSPPMTIVEPFALVMDKMGPGQATLGVPVTYTLDVRNDGDGPAYDLLLRDQLPDTVDGGTCDVAPTNASAQVFESNGSTPVSAPLVEGVDFTLTFTPAPTCELELAFTGANAVVGPTERLIVSYDALLDLDTTDSASLTNVAGAVQWFSWTGPDAREYTEVLTDGTTTVDDHEDAVTVATELPQYRFEKTVVNVTTGQNPAVDASPGDLLRYRIEVENIGTVAGSAFTLVDEPDALNAPAVFQANTLSVISPLPPGADASGTSATGGANGTGIVSIGNLSLPNQNDSLFVEFEIRLQPVVASGTVVPNQAQLVVSGSPIAQSDDPNVGAPPDPLVLGDEDTTDVTIQSAPDFQIRKTSAYVDGDPATLLAGERIQYTITVKNVGTDDATDATLRDAVPVGTTYVAGSTTLNGVAVPDGPGGTSPLATGLPISAPLGAPPGQMPADADVNANNVATLVFEVLVDPAAADGTVVSNQAFVSAILGGVVDQPSDDPRTPLVNDPTRDVVGNLPLLFASKAVAISNDAGTIGIVDPGDRLQYTIVVQNTGAIPATMAQLSDAVPANTTYWPGSTTLNGLAVPDGPGASSPLVAGLPISSASLTPPVPGPGAGTLAPGDVATVVFELVVDLGTAPGTVISNQAVVQTAELAGLLTDGDGNPSTGPEPTVIVVGDVQQLTITKDVTVVGGGAALPGSVLEYEVRVTNVGTLDAQNVLITDDLVPAPPTPQQLTLVPGSATLNGTPAGVTVVGQLITADYSTTYGPLPPGGSVVLRFRATLDPGLAIGTVVTNTADVTWNTPAQMASASVSISVGGMPGVGVLSGAVWHDVDFDLVQGGGENALAGWTVQLLRSGVVAFTTQTDASGAWVISGLEPNDVTGEAYAVRFRSPQAVATTASLGNTDSPFTDGPQLISDVVVASGSVAPDLNLPLQPNGVVYDAVERVPVPGAILQLRNASTGTALPAACFDDPAQQGQVTLADGLYKFDLNFSDAACPSGAGYLIDVTGAAAGYSAGLSQINPPATDASTPPYDVPTCPGDAVPGTALACEVLASAQLPPASVPPRTAGTVFYSHLVLDASQGAFSAQAFNNHIAMDPALDAAVAVTKTTPLTEVVLGQLVPYEITATNQLTTDLLDVAIVDRYPAGFKYVEGSARLDGVPVEPTRTGRELQWPSLDIAPAGTVSLQLLLAVGAGVNDGEYVNRAQIVSGTGSVPLSGVATATVRVVPDPDFACTDVLGKVFDDRNRDGHQDAGEGGLSGVRLVTPRGLVATTDEHGRFHITCPIVPAEGRGSNFVLKLDDRTLPSGYRMSTRTVQVKRATRGKALRFGFGASIDRVVGLDVADAAFEPGGTALRPQWEGRIALLVDELVEAESRLRIAYIGDVESARLVERRVEALESRVRDAWHDRSDAPLTVEHEIYWRRGAPGDRFASFLGRLNPWSGDAGVPPNDGEVLDVADGDSIERHLPVSPPYGQWMTDPDVLDRQRGDRIEQREVEKREARTVKLRNVVPPVRFETGEVALPPSYIQNLRRVLDEMSHLENVRLHFVGHADSQPLTGRLAGEYGDNLGLSRERAGEVAEFVQQALALPPEAISFAWVGDAEPVATNATADGRALNRRVEVEVWYDEFDTTTAVEDVVVTDDIKRVKVCRIETVCKMSFIEGHERRARVRNLVPPLRVGDRGLTVPQSFVDEIAEALRNLSDHSNVTVKFVGYTDDAPLEGREARIYGTHLALSKANAHRAALAVKDALGLRTAAVASDGRGSSQPVASNETERGRGLNRRIEVEFWYDDPLQELDDDLHVCPDAVGESILTKVYDPPWGRIPSIEIVDGEPVIPAELEGTLLRAMGDVGDRENVRLRFVGYTGNESLDRRTALVYGDDVGLSTARARRSMDAVVALMAIEPGRAEAEGRGFVHSDDVVNAGFTQETDSLVVVQVVYDEPAASDDFEGIDITRVTRELKPQDPLSLNLMRITVDGQPRDDRGRSSADVQRCTDVALERAAVEFRFDALEAQRRLSVASDARTVAAGDAGDASDAGAGTGAIRFRMYTNYGHYIERGEVRVFDRQASLQSDPLAVVEVGPDGVAEWRPAPRDLDGPVRELKFVLRAYDEKGRFDETVPQSLWMVNGAGAGGAGAPAVAGDDAREVGRADAALRAGYGETEVAIANIDLGGAGTVRVLGGGVPEGHSVFVAGEPVPVAENGEFIAEAVVPSGLQTVEVAMLDEEGNGELFLRDLEMRKSDWFYVAMADVTLQANFGDGPSEELQGENPTDDPDSFADGRFAFFVTGRFGEDWRLTASADTREGELKDIFSNFLDKSPDALFRRIDPDYHYPTFGDDSTVEQMAPTSGKFFVKLDQGPNHAMWGNFGVRYVDNELARVERGLYGGNVHYETEATTSFGERRVQVDGFAADPGTVSSREDFRGTGGSLYYLKHRDLMVGSERLRVEIRDKVTGLVVGVSYLSPDEDYDIDYFQGRILLARPISATTTDGLLVRNDGLSGNQAWLVVQYEYQPGVDELDALAAGGEGQVWLTDFLKMGVTAYRNGEESADSTLYGAHLLARLSSATWMKLQGGYSEGLVGSQLSSNDGGFGFDGTNAAGFDSAEAPAFRADLSLGLSDVFEPLEGTLSVYFQRLYAGYSVPGLAATTDTDTMGGMLAVPVLDRLAVQLKADRVAETDGLVTNTQELDASFALTDEVSLKAGVRNDDRDDQSPAPPATQEEGGRTDVVVQAELDSGSTWSAYVFGQATVRQTGDRESNNRGGVGGAIRFDDRLEAEGEVAYGDTGPTLQLGTNYQQSAETSRYLNYSLDNERATTGAHARRGSLVNGARTRLSDGASVYQEDRFQHTHSANGLSRAIGLDWAVNERWTIGAEWEYGTLIDAQTLAETKRNAGGGRVSYRFDDLYVSSGIEYRSDDTEQPDQSWSKRTTWLFRNDARLQVNPDWRLLGKFNYSFSNSSLGEFYDGGFTELVLGYAYRPVAHDRLDVLAKYTYFYNRPTTDQVGQNGQATLILQRSHVMSVDVTYDLTRSWTLGGKYAYRLGEVSLDREDPDFFDNSAHLYIGRADWQFLSKWEGSLEGRMLHMPSLGERKGGALITLYRYLGKNLKVGVGYNFTDFSEDLTDLSYDHHGLFFNIIGTL